MYIVETDPQTNTQPQTHRQDRLQYTAQLASWQNVGRIKHTFNRRLNNNRL